MSTLSRRRLLAMGTTLVGGGALVLPRMGRTAPEARDHKFLFVFCRGGWDTTTVFTPAFSLAGVDVEADSALAFAGDLPFVDHPDRPSVRAFLEEWGPQTAFVNGMEVRSVTHERCHRLLMTGSVEGRSDGWPAILAAKGVQETLMPHLVVYGSAFSSAYTSSVVRTGAQGQLPALLDPALLPELGLPEGTALPDALASHTDAFLAARTTEWAQSSHARQAAVGQAYTQALAAAPELAAVLDVVDLSAEGDGCMRHLAQDAAVVFDCFELGLSRCGMVQFDGWCGISFDTHADNAKQSIHHEMLFAYLAEMQADLAARVLADGSTLADETTIVVVSEMGRTPRLNSQGGRDHWTYTSAMLVGAGVAGGQAVGAMDDDLRGRPVDLASGKPSDTGVALDPGHLGATLMALGGVALSETDLDGVAPISAVLA